MQALRREAERLLRGTVEKAAIESEDRIALNIGSNGHGESLVRVVPNGSEVIFRVTGGAMHVQLAKFGNRYRLRVVGMGAWDHLLGERNEIAVLPALGNVVEVAFVMPVPETLAPPLLALEGGTSALNPVPNGQADGAGSGQ